MDNIEKNIFKQMEEEFEKIEKNTIENTRVIEKLEKNMISYEKRIQSDSKRYQELINQLRR